MKANYRLEKHTNYFLRFLKALQTGNFYDYALWMFLGLLSMLILVEFWELMMIIVDPSLVAIFFIATLFSIKTL